MTDKITDFYSAYYAEAVCKSDWEQEPVIGVKIGSF